LLGGRSRELPDGEGRGWLGFWGRKKTHPEDYLVEC